MLRPHGAPSGMLIAHFHLSRATRKWQLAENFKIEIDTRCRCSLQNRSVSRHLSKVWNWLSGEVRTSASYVGFTSSSGHTHAEFPLLLRVVGHLSQMDGAASSGGRRPKTLTNSELTPYDSPWGHCVAIPGNDAEFEKFLNGQKYAALHPPR